MLRLSSPFGSIPEKPKVKLKMEHETSNSKTSRRSSALSLLVLSLTVSILIRSVALQCRCDNSPETKQQRRASSTPATSDSEHQDEDEQFEIAAGNNNNKPRFDESQGQTVFSTRWQSEAFLPCTIVDLDQLQTVSFLLFRARQSAIGDRPPATGNRLRPPIHRSHQSSCRLLFVYSAAPACPDCD